MWKVKILSWVNLILWSRHDLIDILDELWIIAHIHIQPGLRFICVHIAALTEQRPNIRAFSPKKASTPECTLDDGAGRHIWAGRHVSLRPPPISLVYDTAELIGVDVCAWAYVFMNDLRCLAVLQKY